MIWMNEVCFAIRRTFWVWSHYVASLESFLCQWHRINLSAISETGNCVDTSQMDYNSNPIGYKPCHTTTVTNNYVWELTSKCTRVETYPPPHHHHTHIHKSVVEKFNSENEVAFIIYSLQKHTHTPLSTQTTSYRGQ